MSTEENVHLDARSIEKFFLYVLFYAAIPVQARLWQTALAAIIGALITFPRRDVRSAFDRMISREKIIRLPRRLVRGVT